MFIWVFLFFVIVQSASKFNADITLTYNGIYHGCYVTWITKWGGNRNKFRRARWTRGSSILQETLKKEGLAE
jgi:hypothetical protein